MTFRNKSDHVEISGWTWGILFGIVLFILGVITAFVLVNPLWLIIAFFGMVISIFSWVFLKIFSEPREDVKMEETDIPIVGDDLE